MNSTLFFLKVVFGYSSFFSFPYKFENQVLISILKKNCWYFYWHYIESIHHYWENWHLNNNDSSDQWSKDISIYFSLFHCLSAIFFSFQNTCPKYLLTDLSLSVLMLNMDRISSYFSGFMKQKLMPWISDLCSFLI